MNDDIKIIEVRIRNFRCLKSISVKLDDLTLLTGQNNSGKTSFIKAFEAAIGVGRQIFTEEDIYLAQSEKRPPQDRSIIVDLLIRPWNRIENEIIDVFPQGSFWLELWGDGTAQDKDDNDFIGMRTEYKWNRRKIDYSITRSFLNEWKEDLEEIEQAKKIEKAGFISYDMIEPIALYLMDEKRDIIDEFKKKTSFWYKLISDPGLKEDEIKKFEKILNNLNLDIIKGSAVLKHILDHLNDLYPIISHEIGKAKIFPIPRQLDDLSKGIDIGISTENSQTFSLTRYGMGTRSLATIVLFKAYITLKQKRMQNIKMHPMLAIEEPENHLHPQAQHSIFDLIKNIQGQIILTTHSPYIIECAKIQQIRHFQKIGSVAQIYQMDVKDLTDDDLRKINYMVLKTRGYMIYARALILAEGETDERGLPTFAEEYWSKHPTNLGIEFIGVGGDGNYLPFLRLAQSFGIRWYIFSDGEAEVITNVNRALSKINEQLIPNNPLVFVIPNNENYESYLIKPEHKEELIEMYINLKGEQSEYKDALKEDFDQNRKTLDDILQYARDKKTKCAIPLAKAVLKNNDKNLKYPEKIRLLFEKISSDLNLPTK